MEENYGIEIHVSAVRGLLNLCDLLGRRPVKKLMLSTKNRKDRVAFAKRYKKKTVEWSPMYCGVMTGTLI